MIPCGKDERVCHEAGEHHGRKLGLGRLVGTQPIELFVPQGDLGCKKL